jgi:signal peptidase I
MEEVTELNNTETEDVAEVRNPIKRPTRIRGFTVFLLSILGIVLVFYPFFKMAVVKGESMIPTLHPGQRVLTSHAYWLVGRVRVNDIIVLKEEKSQDYFIKRVVGLPGDKIPWSNGPMNWPIDKDQYVVPEGRIYVMGDNLNHSDDSRKFGAFLQSNILGKVLTWR